MVNNTEDRLRRVLAAKKTADEDAQTAEAEQLRLENERDAEAARVKSAYDIYAAAFDAAMKRFNSEIADSGLVIGLHLSAQPIKRALASGTLDVDGGASRPVVTYVVSTSGEVRAEHTRPVAGATSPVVRPGVKPARGSTKKLSMIGSVENLDDSHFREFFVRMLEMAMEKG